jgi:hypothetical protein
MFPLLLFLSTRDDKQKAANDQNKTKMRKVFETNEDKRNKLIFLQSMIVGVEHKIIRFVDSPPFIDFFTSDTKTRNAFFFIKI